MRFSLTPHLGHSSTVTRNSGEATPAPGGSEY